VTRLPEPEHPRHEGPSGLAEETMAGRMTRTESYSERVGLVVGFLNLAMERIAARPCAPHVLNPKECPSCIARAALIACGLDEETNPERSI